MSRRRFQPSVMRACEPLAYTGWLRPSRMTFGCGSAPGMLRRDDVDVMAATARFAGEEMDVLADATQVRIVVLRDQRDAQRTLVALGGFEIGQVRERRVVTTQALALLEVDSRAAWAAARRAIGTR